MKILIPTILFSLTVILSGDNLYFVHLTQDNHEIAIKKLIITDK